ncbi:MAG: TRAP transporter small permease subunit [Rhodospirillales bacterium]|nr:TRAP transporter small permease subunit [Rhodospirillales bacterium]
MKKLYEAVCRTEVVMAQVFLVVMVVLIFSAGIARLIGHPINWTIDVATCVFAWACFLSADVAWRKGKLMSVDVITKHLSERAQRSFRMVNYAILTVFLLYLVPTGLYLAWVSRERSFQGIPEFSYSWVTMSVPVCGTLLLITTLLKIRDEVREGRLSMPRP